MSVQLTEFKLRLWEKSDRFGLNLLRRALTHMLCIRVLARLTLVPSQPSSLWDLTCASSDGCHVETMI